MLSDNEKKQSEETDNVAYHRIRMHTDWNNLIEDLIEAGREQGVFDNLPGRGKPLKLNKNIYGADQELANELLRHNDLKPAWLMNRNHIRDKVEWLRADVQSNWQRHARAYEMAADAGHRGALVISWDDACLRWETKIAELNKLVDDFNLKRPSNNLEMFKIRLADELRRAGARRYLKPLSLPNEAQSD